MFPIVADILAATNVILAGIAAIFGIRFWRKCSKPKTFCFIKLLISAIALYWCGLYVFVLIASPGDYNSVLFGQIYIRPAFTITLALMAISALYRYRSGE